MASKRDFNKRKHDNKKKLSIADEREYRDNDRASKWLKAVEDKKQKS